MTRRDYLALSAALRRSKGLTPVPATPQEAADLQHRACAEAVCSVLEQAPGFDQGRFLGDSGVRPAVRLLFGD